MSNINEFPPLADADELERERDNKFLPQDEWEDVDISGDWLDVTEEYQRPKWTLAYDGVPFAPLGGIHALTGQPGHGKTMTFTQIMVAILRGEYGKLTYQLADEVAQPKVLYIDTEMEKGNTQLVNLRVYSMMNWSYGIPHDEFRVIMLRETENAVDRWRKTLKAIYEVRPTVCFIDGLLDVVNDFNDNKECQEIIYKCMKVASHYGISLWCLVHENPGTTKMVGHMGSVLERKVTDAFGTIKDKDSMTGDVTFTVKQKKARGKDVPDWNFKVLDDKNKFGIPEQNDTQSTNASDEKYNNLLAAMQATQFRANGKSWTELEGNLKAAGYGRNERQRMIKDAVNLEILFKADNGRYYFSEKNTTAREGNIENETKPF